MAWGAPSTTAATRRQTLAPGPSGTTAPAPRQRVFLADHAVYITDWTTAGECGGTCCNPVRGNGATRMLDTLPLAQIKDAVGPRGWTDDPAEMAPWLEDSRAAYHGQCAPMVRPSSTDEVVASGLPRPRHPGGAAGRQYRPLRRGDADTSGNAVLLNLSRMNRIRDIDAADFTITVEAGAS